MTFDPLARKLTIGYEGGAIAAPKGTLVAMFGPELVAAEAQEEIEIERDSHKRRYVPGGPQTDVRAATFTMTKYGTRSQAGGSGGEEIMVVINSEDWTARLSGSHQAFCKFLKNATWQSGWEGLWRSRKGTSYGPFRGDEPTP